MMGLTKLFFISVALASAAKFGVLMGADPHLPNSTLEPGFGILDDNTGVFEQVCKPSA